MATDNTSASNDSQASDTAITDQNTLDEALKHTEPVEEVEGSTEETESQKPSLEKKEETDEFTFLNKYKSKEQAEKAFRSMQELARKNAERIKELEKEKEQQALKDFKSMDYDQQIEFLVKDAQQNKEALKKLESVLVEQAQESDQVQLEKFIQSEPLIAETGLENQFRLLATHPELQQYSFESIFKTMLKPDIEKIMGKKITVKERKILSDTVAPQVDEFSPDSIARMSPQEYAKNREKILKASGVNI